MENRSLCACPSRPLAEFGSSGTVISSVAVAVMVESASLGVSTLERERRALELEQRSLHVQPAGVAGEGAVRADYAMARKDDRDRVAVHHGAHCARGPRTPDLRGQRPVGVDASVGHECKLAQHGLVERRHPQVER